MIGNRFFNFKVYEDHPLSVSFCVSFLEILTKKFQQSSVDILAFFHLNHDPVESKISTSTEERPEAETFRV